MLKPKIIFAVIMIMLYFGCAAIDLTENHKGPLSLCEVHYCEMHPEYIDVSGEIAYLLDYQRIAKKQFPNHGGHLYNFEKANAPYERDVIDFVCLKCHEEYSKFL